VDNKNGKTFSDGKLKELEALAVLHSLPDSTPLTTQEAALFLRSSVSALEVLRRCGTGLVYMQHSAKGLTGPNQKCLYQKRDLLAWIESNKVSSVVQAAVRKGQL
jgi:hypothetical protein